MASCTVYSEARADWKESVSEQSRDTLCERILEIIQAQMPDICGNTELNIRFLNYIRSGVEKSWIEATAQKEFIQKVSRQICHLIAKVQTSLNTKDLTNYAKAKVKAQMLHRGQKADPSSSLVQKMIELDLGNKSEVFGQNLGSFGCIQTQMPCEITFRDPRTGFALSNLPNRLQVATNQQQLVSQETGECSNSGDVPLPPIEYAQKTLENDVRVNPDMQFWRRKCAKYEAQFIKWQVPDLLIVFVDTTLRSLQLQEMRQKIQQYQTEEEAKEFEVQLNYSKRVDECVKLAVKPKELLPDDFDEASLEFLKLEVSYLLENYKRGPFK